MKLLNHLWTKPSSRVVQVFTILASVIGLIGFLLVVCAFFPGENYNYIYPSIDTKFAPGFSESAFSQVSTGMLAPDVTQILGNPLYRERHEDGTETWDYTSDGKCSWGDFAWLSREITFRNGRVILVERGVYYD